MSVFSALSYGVAGMQAQSNRLAALSNNIANSSTDGYRRSDVDFAALVTSGGVGEAAAPSGGVRTIGRTDITRSGAIEASTSGTHLAINGGGFFLVDDAASPSGAPLLTRAGQFSVNADGLLVNSAGYALLGARLNPDGTPIGSVTDIANLEAMQVGALNFTGSPTTEVSVTANLPADLTGAANPPEVTTLTVFDELANPRTLTLEWQPSAALANNWTLNISDNGVAVGSVDIAFNATGAAAGAPATYASALPIAGGVVSVPINGGAQTIALNLGEPGSYDGLTQFTGAYSSSTTRDGAGFGAFSGVEVDESGVVFARFDNGETRAVYQIPLARAANENALNAVDGQAFQATVQSGEIRLDRPGANGRGALAAFAIERSNVDIAEELTALIETQRAYSSATTIVQTADEMLEEATRLKR